MGLVKTSPFQSQYVRRWLFWPQLPLAVLLHCSVCLSTLRHAGRLSNVYFSIFCLCVCLSAASAKSVCLRGKSVLLNAFHFLPSLRLSMDTLSDSTLVWSFFNDSHSCNCVFFSFRYVFMYFCLCLPQVVNLSAIHFLPFIRCVSRSPHQSLDVVWSYFELYLCINVFAYFSLCLPPVLNLFFLKHFISCHCQWILSSQSLSSSKKKSQYFSWT